MMRGTAVVVCLGLLLGACTDLKISEEGPSISEIQTMPLDEARSHLAGQTVVTFIERHQSCPDRLHGHGYCKWVEGPGTQVEFFAEDGRWFLWSPEASELAAGEWVLREWRNRYHVCIASTGETRNALARFLQEDGYRCALLSEYARKVADAQEADPFDLASGRMPFPLRADPATIDALLNHPPSS
jgi:hypothetical protein